LLSIGCGSHAGNPAAPTSAPAAVNDTFIVLVQPTMMAPGESGRGYSYLEHQGVDLSAETLWSSQDPLVATITSGGEVKALSSGIARITGVYRNQTGTFNLQVLAASDIVDMLIWNGSYLSLGDTAGFAPRLVLAPGNVIKDVYPPSLAQYSSSSLAVGTISKDGLLSTLSVGITDVTVSYAGKSVTKRVNVVPAGYDSVTIEQSTITGDLSVGSTITVSMLLSYSLGSTDTGQVTIREFDLNYPANQIGVFPRVDVKKDGPPVTVTGTITIPSGLPSVCPTAVLIMSSGKEVGMHDSCRGVKR
jgi:hypothetical protein